MSKKASDRKGSPYHLKSAKLPEQVGLVTEIVRDLGAEVALLEGGALMDAQLGRVPRDFDLQLYMPEAKRVRALEALEAQASVMHEFNPRAVVVHLKQGPILDVRFLDKPKTPQQAMRELSVGVSAIVYDMLTGHTWVAPEFEQDHAAQKIRPRRHIQPGRQLEEYLAKLARKLPSYSRT